MKLICWLFGHRLERAEERRRLIKTGVCQRLSKRQRLLTPEPFRDLLITIARGVTSQ